MSTDPEQIRSVIDGLLAEIPEPGAQDGDLDVVAARLDQAHELLIAALESVERHPSGSSG